MAFNYNKYKGAQYSSPVKHIGRHPSPKDGHTHKGQKLFQRVHGALTGTEGKKFVDTKVGEGVSHAIGVVQDFGTDIKTGQKLWSTRNKRIKDYTRKHSYIGKLEEERRKAEERMEKELPKGGSEVDTDIYK